MKYLVIIRGILGAVLLYLLSSASANTELFSHNYYVLLVMTGGLAVALAGLVASQIWQLRHKLKQRVYGARLTLRLVLIFSVIAILPGLLVYAVSVQFLSKSIESWFDVRVEKALRLPRRGRPVADAGAAALRRGGLPASYANFYVCNAAVLVPTFNDPNDRVALGILSELFRDRPVAGIHSVDLAWGFGTLHCLTQQQPAANREGKRKVSPGKPP